MSFEFVDDLAKAESLADLLEGVQSVALDCEAAGFHRYSDRLCLVQLSLRDRTYVIDPLAFDPTELLRPLVEDPAIEVVMHGADFDVRLLDRDLDLRLRGLFDTQAAAAILGIRALGLQSLLESELDVDLAKKYQRADWAKRPLPDDMLRYAANDTRHLHELRDRLLDRLDEKDRVAWAREEFRELESIRWEEDDDEEDPVVRVKAARDMSAREITGLREALAWRDRVARERDRAPFRIAGDDVLVSAVRERPVSTHELGKLRGMNRSLAEQEGAALLERLARVDQLPESQLVGYPEIERNGRRRPPPEVEERTDRLRRVRNRRSDELGIDRGTLLSNAVLREIAEHEPGSADELEAVPGVKRWQVEALGAGILTELSS